MAKVAVEHVFNGTTTGVTSYDSNYTMIGSLYSQYSGATTDDVFITLKESTISSIVDTTTFSFNFPFVYQWSDNIFWIFLADNSAVAATRRVGLYYFNQSNSSLSYQGFITLQGTTVPGNKTVRGIRATVTTHTTGTVGVTGTTVTGR